jgi:hypothetical protein
VPQELASQPGPSFVSAFDKTPDRVWIGPEYWANPLQDWRVAGGALECAKAAPNRSLILLTRELSARLEPFSSSIAIAPWPAGSERAASAWLGFRIAARGRFGDYRDDAVYGEGIDAGMRADGSLFIGDSSNAGVGDAATIRQLRIALVEAGGGWQLRLSTIGPDERVRATTVLPIADPRDLRGAIGVVCQDVACRVNEWRVEGPKVDARDEHAFGPILFTQYTVSGSILKLTAQMPPIGPRDVQEVRLAVPGTAGRLDGGTAAAWREIARATIDPLARTATFRVANWDDGRDQTYRVLYAVTDAGGVVRDAIFDGTIRRDRGAEAQTVVAAFTGNNDLGFPHADVVRHVSTFKPDLLVFTGDQIYEPVGGFGVQRSPLDMAALDYLRKWYICRKRET